MLLGMGCITLMASERETRAGEPLFLQSQPVSSVSMNAVSGGDVQGGQEKNEAKKEDEEKRNEEIVIVLDAGHGGEDEGCSCGGILEKEINLRITLAVRDKLSELGYQVLLTRETDQALSLQERVEIADGAGADIFVSIHQNASEVSQACGLETWYLEKESETQQHGQNMERGSFRLAELIRKFTLERTGAADREMKSADTLYVLRETDMPACLVETGFLSNKEERERLLEEEYQLKLAAGIVEGIDLYFHPKTMYLTFDDGPSVETTGAILDILREKNIKATFFVVGENVKKHPEMARRIVNEGHTIGIHCNWHEYETLYESVDSYLEDFYEAYDIIYETTGVEAELFRFPGGSINAYNEEVYEDIIKEMTKRGFVYFDWNASLEDAVKNPDPQILLKNARESTLGRKKVVMLAHDIVYSTAQCLEEMIEQFPEYRMLPLTKEVTPIQF